jgi:hypothetical protein
MTIIYIHGAKVRDPAHGQGLERPFRRWVYPALKLRNQDPAYIPVFWGDVAARFRWKLESRPRTFLLQQGGEAGFAGLGSLREDGGQSPLDLATFAVRLAGLESVVIEGGPKSGSLFGLDYALEPKTAGVNPFKQFELDLSGGAPKFALHADADFKLFYKKLSANGRGLVFHVTQFAVAKGGVSLAASIDPTEPVTLPGVGVTFTSLLGVSHATYLVAKASNTKDLGTQAK